MELIRIPRIMQQTSKEHLLLSKSIGLVPTMGALHEGHLSLVRTSKKENDATVVSIFVNPKQFGLSEDFSKYPRDIGGDTAKLEDAGVDMLFLPDDSLMYPEGSSTHVEVEGLSDRLCGLFRPGHFRGVATVVLKLFNIVTPVRAYFGQKDFQQTVIIKRLVRDLDLGTDVVVCPTLREEDGLAMSSRNLYLSPEERKAATVIYRALVEASKTVKNGILEVRKIKDTMLNILRTEPLVKEVQYCSAFDTGTLIELERIKGEALLAIALHIGSTRLIDNMVVTTGNGGR